MKSYTNRIARARLRQADDFAWRMYNYLALGIGVALATVPAIWLLNISGYQAVALLFYFLALFPGAYVLFQPKMQFYVASAGAAIGVATRADTASSAQSALSFWNRLVISFIFWYWWICLLLATWSFAESPVAFWYVAAAVALLAIMTIHLQIDGRKRTIIVTTLFAFAVIGYSLYQSQKTRADTTMAWVEETVVGTTSPADNIACPVRTCFFVNSTKWSARVPTGKKLSWLRSDSPDTVLEMRPDGDEDRIKVWRNHTDVSFKKSAYVQVRLKKGSGAMVYFDNPTKIAALESGR